jgi:hypothetical protein
VAVAVGMGLVLVLSPLLLLRNPTAPQEGTVVAAAAAAGPVAAPRRFTVRAARSSVAARIAADAVLATTTTTASPPKSGDRPVHDRPIAQHRVVAAAVAPSPPTTTSPPRPAPTTTAPAPPPPPPTTAPPPPPPAPAHSETGEASWYRGPDGECAHNRAPIGSVIRVTNLDNGRSTTCRVAGRGPYGAGRIVDLTLSTFARVADPDAGVFHARVEW